MNMFYLMKVVNLGRNIFHFFMFSPLNESFSQKNIMGVSFLILGFSGGSSRIATGKLYSFNAWSLLTS